MKSLFFFFDALDIFATFLQAMLLIMCKLP